jgi:hypothetical protein
MIRDGVVGLHNETGTRSNRDFVPGNREYLERNRPGRIDSAEYAGCCGKNLVRTGKVQNFDLIKNEYSNRNGHQNSYCRKSPAAKKHSEERVALFVVRVHLPC